MFIPVERSYLLIAVWMGLGGKLSVKLKEVLEKKWSRESMRGSFALLDFWATWCGPCVAEFPSLREAHRRFKDQGFAILAISLDSDQR